MKSNPCLTPALFVLGLFLFCPTPGQCFYNASTGRWLSRDPIQEDGGFDLYEFVGDCPIDNVDVLGQFSVDRGTRTVHLAKCDIGILYGHGSGLKRRHWRWTHDDAGCSAGAAIMCWPDTNMDGLPDEMRLWTSWGGESLSEANWEKVFWGLPANGADFFEGTMHFHMPNAKKVLLLHVLVNAVQKAWHICDAKVCGCGKITINFVQIDKHGRVVDPSRPDGDVPQMPKQVTITCPGGVISCP